jgi:hypothetical protein
MLHLLSSLTDDHPRLLVQAYLDPGTGSMLIQLVLAGLLSAAASFKRVRTYVAFTFQRLFGKKKPADLPPAASTQK